MLRSTARRPFWFFLCLALLGGRFAYAQETTAPTAPTAPAAPSAADPLAPPAVVKPVVPSKAELAESAFRKLDATNKGYVTMEDAAGLEGFAPAFREADDAGTGKLDLQQFKRAWAQYSGYQ